MEKIFDLINSIIKEQKTARENNDYLTLMVNAERLLEGIPYIIKYSVEQESEYRKYEAKLANEIVDNKLRSSAYCETQAKATDFYREWQRSKLVMELIYEMVNLSKRLAQSVNNEFNSN